VLEVGTTFNTHLEDAPILSAVKMRDLGSTTWYTAVHGVTSGGDGVGSWDNIQHSRTLH
jgi:hypothetical protein